MKIKQFVIGNTFTTATGTWVCVDIATRHVLAVKEDPKKPGFELLTKFKDSVEPTVFSLDDMEACRYPETKG